jgi:hypothetical protein
VSNVEVDSDRTGRKILDPGPVIGLTAAQRAGDVYSCKEEGGRL